MTAVVDQKRCSICGETKPAKDFHRNRSKRDGLTSSCKPCSIAQRASWLAAQEPGLANRYRAKWVRENPDKVRASQRRNYAQNREAILEQRRSDYADKRTYLTDRYGLTGTDYDRMLEQQSGECAICHTVPSETLHVDHDHESGEVRGLLCRKCNLAIGLLGDSSDVALSASAYLTRSRGTKEPK